MITRENREKLLIAKPAMRADVHAFIMTQYLASVDDAEEVLEPLHNLCGMACCIAGSFVAAHDKVNLMVAYGITNRSLIPGRATEIMGEFPDVFLLDRWPDRLVLAYDQAKTDHDRVEVACQAVDEWVENPKAFSRSGTGEYTDEDWIPNRTISD